MADASIIIDSIIIFFLLIGSAFFSSSETSLTAVSRARIYKLQSEGNKRAKRVARLRERKEALIGTILLGNNIVNIAATAISTSLAIRLFGENGVVYATFAVTIIVLIFGEIMPKSFAFQHAEKVALVVARPLEFLVKIFAPVTHTIQLFITQLLKLFGVDFHTQDTLISATDLIRGTIEMHHQEGDVIKQEKDMLGSILDLNEVEICEVMTHRKQLESIDVNTPVQQIIRQVGASSHSRIPFWRDDPENIIGILHVRDLMRLVLSQSKKPDNADIEALLAPPWFVPENTTLSQQLHAFRSKKRHFAVVVNEYGGCEGIITLEDILEEIVGEIDDEHDIAAKTGVKRLEQGGYRVDGTITIRDINRALDWNLPDEDAATIAGLVIHESRSIPEAGATFQFYGYRFTIVEKRSNQLTKLDIEKIPEEVE